MKTQYSMRSPKKFLGGLGLRSQHYNHILENKTKHCTWFEVISENYMNTEGRPLFVLDKIREDFPIALHGVSLSVGSPDPINLEYLKSLKQLIERIDPFIVSDHFCWTGNQGLNSHDLLPIPYTKAHLNLIIEKINQTQDFLNRPILLENPSAYISFEENEMNEVDFMNAACSQTGCGLLLDINNVFVTCRNFNLNPIEYLEQILVDKVGQIHLAGFTEMKNFLYDTHANPVSNDVWYLFEKFMTIKSEIPVMIEWDEDIPEFETLENELLKAILIRERILETKNNKIIMTESQNQILIQDKNKNENVNENLNMNVNEKQNSELRVQNESI